MNPAIVYDTTIYQKRDFNAGGNFVQQIHHAMRHTKRTMAVLSPDYLEAHFTLSEWAEAFRRDPTGEYALLVPVRVSQCEVDGVLGLSSISTCWGCRPKRRPSGWWNRYR